MQVVPVGMYYMDINDKTTTTEYYTNGNENTWLQYSQIVLIKKILFLIE